MVGGLGRLYLSPVLGRWDPELRGDVLQVAQAARRQCPSATPATPRGARGAQSRRGRAVFWIPCPLFWGRPTITNALAYIVLLPDLVLYGAQASTFGVSSSL